jgi:penicillin G amidase
MRRLRRIVLGVVALVALAVVVAAALATWKLRASLADLDGRVSLSGLTAEVAVERDALGVPVLRGSTRLDLVRATGFVHAQDRFFQMDLLRRAGAGELAVLLGPALLDRDRATRMHRFRARAVEDVGQADPENRATLEAYAAGVNAGLAALGAAPPEYLLLRQRPQPWRPEDTYLVVMAMFLDLQDDTCRRESQRGVLFDAVPAEAAAFLTPTGTEWDAPIEGPALDVPPVPPAATLALGSHAAHATHDPPSDPEGAVAGSNNWAVAGAHTVHGGAMLANDMHLGHSLPNIWYRMSIVLPGADGRALTGVTLPGTPTIAAGSNGRVAWGFTNTHADWCDLVVLEQPGSDPEEYSTTDGPRRLEHHVERIEVRGSAAVELDVAETIWGPVIDRDHRGQARALRWVAQRPGASDFGLQRLENVSTVEEALDVASTSGIPAQNFVVADHSGSIGWTVMGRIPRRSVSPPPTVPVSWRDAGTWDGWLEPQACPRIVNPPAGRIWTANNRVVEGAALALIGEGSYDLGARARQIRDDLLAIPRATEADLLAVQLDDRALFLGRWRDLLLELLTPEALADHPRRAELREVVESGWTGRASIDSAAYRFVRAFRLETAERVIGAIEAPAKAVDERFSFWSTTVQIEGPLWRIVTERPAHLLEPTFPSWDAWLLSAADATIERIADTPEKRLRDRTWGERNTVRVGHPLSQGVPALARWLDLPPQPLPGDSGMPRVQSPGFGASERMVVSPGREASGIFHMPGGQSGHPLSPFYRAGHEAWAEGRPTPFLPGPVEHRLVLRP